MDYQIKNAKFVVLPTSTRLRASLLLMNKSPESIELKRITGKVKVNGIEAAFIDQTIKQIIKPGQNTVELNFEVFLQNAVTLFENRFKAVVNFSGIVEAEGLRLPVNFNYDV